MSELLNTVKTRYNYALSKEQTLRSNFWIDRCYVDPTEQGLSKFLKLKEQVALTSQTVNANNGPKANPLLNEEAQQVVDLLNYQTSENIVNQYMDLYMSPVALGDINYRLGNVVGIKNDHTVHAQSDKFGNLYTTNSMSTRLRKYICDSSGNYKDVGEYYVNLLFPPYTSPNKNDVSSSLSWWTNYKERYNKGSLEGTFSPDYLLRSPIEATYRTPGFKLVNDNINFLQKIFEGLSGIVSTYMTEWDLSLYMQERLMSTFKNDNLYIDSFMWLNYRLFEDNPYKSTDEYELATLATVNYAVSKIKNTNVIPYLPEKYPQSKWWTPMNDFGYYTDDGQYIMSAYKLFADTTNPLANFPYYRVAEVGPKGVNPLILKQTLPEHISVFTEKLRFDDYRNACMSGWPLISKMATYQTLYTNSGDGIDEIDNILLDGYLQNMPKALIAQGVAATLGASPEEDEGEVTSNSDVDLGSDIAADANPISVNSYSDIKILKCSIPGSKLLKMFLNRKSIESSANKTSGTRATNRQNGLTSSFIAPKSLNNENNNGSSAMSMNQTGGTDLKAGGMTTSIEYDEQGREVKYLTDESENTKYSSFDGISPCNPFFFGGPHGYNKSPETLQGYFETNNRFLRDSSRVGLFDTTGSGNNLSYKREELLNLKDFDAYKAKFSEFKQGVELTYFNRNSSVNDLKSRSPTSAMSILKNGVMWFHKKLVSVWSNTDQYGRELIKVTKPIPGYNRGWDSHYDRHYTDYSNYVGQYQNYRGISYYNDHYQWNSLIAYMERVSCGCQYMYGQISRSNCYHCSGHISHVGLGYSAYDHGWHDKFRKESKTMLPTYDRNAHYYYTYHWVLSGISWSWWSGFTLHYRQVQQRHLRTYGTWNDWTSYWINRKTVNNCHWYHSYRQDYHYIDRRSSGYGETFNYYRLTQKQILETHYHDMPYKSWSINKVKFQEYNVSHSWNSGWPGFFRSIWNWLKGGPSNVRQLTYSVTALPATETYVLRTSPFGRNNDRYWGGMEDDWDWEVANQFLSNTGNMWTYDNHNIIMCETDDYGNYKRLFSTRLRGRERKIVIYRWEVVRSYREKHGCSWRTCYDWGWVPRTYYKKYIEAELEAMPDFMSSCIYRAPKDLSGDNFLEKSIEKFDNSSELVSAHPADLRDVSSRPFYYNSGYHPGTGKFFDETTSTHGITGYGMLTKIQGIDPHVQKIHENGILYDTRYHHDWLKDVKTTAGKNATIKNITRQYTRVIGYESPRRFSYGDGYGILGYDKPIVGRYTMPWNLNFAINCALLNLTFYKFDADVSNYAVWYNTHITDGLRLFFVIMARQYSFLLNAKDVFGNTALDNMHLILNNSVDQNIVKTSKVLPSEYVEMGSQVLKEPALFNFWIFLANGLFYNKESCKKSVAIWKEKLNERINLYKTILDNPIAKKLIRSNDVFTYNDIYWGLLQVDIVGNKLRTDKLSLSSIAEKSEIETKNISQIKDIFNNITLDEFFYVYLNLLYQYRRYFINKRFNKVDGTYWALRHYENLCRFALSKSSTVNMPPLESDSYDGPKTLPIIMYLLNNTPETKLKALLDEVDPLSEDSIKWVFHKVEYYTGKESKLIKVVDSAYGDIKNPTVGAPGCYWTLGKGGAIIIELLNGRKAFKPYTYNYRLLSDAVKYSDDLKADLELKTDQTEVNEFLKTFQDKIINDVGCSKDDNFHISWSVDKTTSAQKDYSILNIKQEDGRVVKKSGIWYDYVNGFDVKNLDIDKLRNGDILQDVICQNGEKIDLWAVRIPDDKMPPVKHYVNGMALVPYYDIPDDSPELGVESVVGGVLSYTLWPIKEQQSESVIPEEYKPLGLYDPS